MELAGGSVVGSIGGLQLLHAQIMLSLIVLGCLQLPACMMIKHYNKCKIKPYVLFHGMRWLIKVPTRCKHT